MNACGYCGNPAEQGHICDQCAALTIRSLTMLPPIIADLRSMMTSIKAATFDQIRVDTSRTAQLGADFTLSDRANALYAIAADWVVSWAAVVGKPAPGKLEGWNTNTRVTALPSGLSSFTAASSVARWLIANHDAIALHEDSPAYAIAVTNAIQAEGRALGYRPKMQAVPDRLCRECHSPKLRLNLPVEGAATIICTACGGEWPCGPKLIRAALAR